MVGIAFGIAVSAANSIAGIRIRLVCENAVAGAEPIVPDREPTLQEQIEACEKEANLERLVSPNRGRELALRAAARTLRELQESCVVYPHDWNRNPERCSRCGRLRPNL